MAEDIKYKKKKKLGSYPSFSVVFSISLALFVIGLFGLMLLYTQKLTTYIKENVEVQVYLDKFISESETIRIRTILSDSRYISKKDGEPQIRFISKEEAAEKFIQETSEDFTEFLGENPLRDVYVINIQNDFQTAEHMGIVQKEIENIPGVFEVTYLESLVDSINKNTAKIAIILVAFAVIMLFVVTILINNTIKLALFSQRFLIRSMQLVGAKGSFIQAPFLKRAFFYGILGGIIASALLYALLQYGNQNIDGLDNLQNPIEIMSLFGLLITFGAIIGFLSTYRSVNKYLKMSLDELY
ncbi:cell division protein FtsX [Bacteroidota bacterium]